MFGIYKQYPFKIPARTKLFNLGRAVFLLPAFEKMLTSWLKINRSPFWKKLIPPVYLYREGARRMARRDGISYTLDLSKMLDHSIYFHDLNDPAWSNLFTILHNDFIVIDAGANIGYLTVQFAQRCSKGRVYSFEPDSDNFACLSENVRLNQLSNVTLFKAGLGEYSGSARLYKVYRNNPGANRIQEQAPPEAYAHEVVTITTIDEVVRSNNIQKIDLIKIDVEGFELFVLKGAVEIIRKCKPILFVELMDQNTSAQQYSSADIVNQIKDYGYDIVDAKTMKELKLSATYHTDIICVPAGNSKP